LINKILEDGNKINSSHKCFVQSLVEQKLISLGFIVLFELTDSESEPLDKQGCAMQQTPRRAFPAPAPQQVTVPNRGAEIRATR